MQHIVFILRTGSALWISCLIGCGGYNAELSTIHRSGPDCSMSGCHVSAGAGGTVYVDYKGTAPLPGATVEALSPTDGTTVELVLGHTDSLGLFIYFPPLQGQFIMSANGFTSQTTVHLFPAYKGCNSCHSYPTLEPLPLRGRIYGEVAPSP